jgi:cell division protein FtsL
MLSDAEKERIRLEEILRNEIRNELAKNSAGTTASSKFWKFLNSTLGIWLLSAIFISGAGGAFTYVQQRQAEKQKEHDVVERLDLEISYRFSQILLRLYNLTEMTHPRANLSNKHTVSEVKQVLQILHESPSRTITPLYPEFSGLGIPSLMAELKRHTHDDRTRKEIDLTLAAVTGKDIEDGDLSDVNAKAGAILQGLMLPRWKNSAFYFIDCSEAAPFC